MSLHLGKLGKREWSRAECPGKHRCREVGDAGKAVGREAWASGACRVTDLLVEQAE
jgi:hypothetical protein